MRFLRLTVAIAALVTVGCAHPASSDSASAPPTAQETSGNPAQCITEYTEGTDYFPDKVTFEHAAGITVEYHESYKVVEVSEPLQGLEPATYVFVQCGAPGPKLEGELAAAPIIEIPVSKVATSSATQLPAFEMLDRIDAIAGVESTEYVYSEAIRAAVDAGAISGYGTPAGEISVEQVVALEPDVFVAGGIPNPSYEAVAAAGIPIVGNAEWLETTPLGRAEWLKFTALMTNTEARANEQFATIVKDYERTAKLTVDVGRRPSVVTGAPYQGEWFRAQGESYLARFLADAGADYVFADVPGTSSEPVSLEVVLAEASDAQFWLNADNIEWHTTADIVADDSRLGEMAAVGLGNVFNPTLRVNDTGGNDYWQLGVARPDLVLADMTAIFHPDLLPDHEFTFYQRLA